MTKVHTILTFFLIFLVSCSSKPEIKNINVNNDDYKETSNELIKDEYSSEKNNITLNESEKEKLKLIEESRTELPNTEFIKPSITVLTPLEIIEVNGEGDILYGKYFIEFYKRHQDDYDFLAVYYNFPTKYGSSGGAVSNNVKGIGQPIFFVDDEFGSKDRLQSVGNMGYLDPSYLPLTEDWTAYNLLFEEVIGHRWGISVGNHQDEEGPLPVQNTLSGGHWTPCMSFPRKEPKQPFWKGGLWHEKGNNIWERQQEFYNTYEIFDPFMLYFMGFLPPEKVPNATLVMPFGENKAKQCVEKLTLQGTSRIISINDVIALYGPRDPSYKYSQKKFTMGFILLVNKNTTPSPIVTEAIQRWAAGFPKEFERAVSTEDYTK